MNGRGDVIGPLICLCRGDDDGARADSRAWAAVVLSRIYLLDGRFTLASFYLNRSVKLFQKLPRGDIPLGLRVDRAICMKWRGNTHRAEILLQRVFERAVRDGESLTAARAASNLALILVRSGRPDEARSAVDFARSSYRALRLDHELDRADLVLSLIEFAGGRCEEAIDRVHRCVGRCGERGDGHGAISGALLLFEMSLRRNDDAHADRYAECISRREDLLRRFQPLLLRFLYLHSIHRRKRGERGEARDVWRRAERLRRRIGVGRRGQNRLPSAGKPYSGTNGDQLSTVFLADRSVPEGSAEPRGPYGVTTSAACAGGAGDTFMTANRRMVHILNEVRRAAPLPLPVLIEGETGVGKELVSRLIHASSGRERQPFVPVNVAALPHELFESILFGHARGAFTGATSQRRGLVEAAAGGTLFLDEIGEIDPHVQAKLLRLLDRGEYIPIGECSQKLNHARIIASTNRDLAAAVESGDFRKDLYHRLKVLDFRIPPLRERRDDIPLLVEHFVQWCRAQYRLGSLRISEAAMKLLTTYDWPGNVRELRHEVIRAAMRQRRGTVHACHLSARIIGRFGGRGASPADSLQARLDAYERGEIMNALREEDGNRTRAAAVLGLQRTTLFYRMKRLAIE
ncbi:MAG TPA: sigma 54-interacting transcriptional regulator [Patescibacteria group bacterium]|nr:sigma 54-interacting transcriptional regulator [Patescibacteria group bacterium]